MTPTLTLALCFFGYALLSLLRQVIIHHDFQEVRSELDELRRDLVELRHECELQRIDVHVCAERIAQHETELRKLREDFHSFATEQFFGGLDQVLTFDSVKASLLTAKGSPAEIQAVASFFVAQKGGAE